MMIRKLFFLSFLCFTTIGKAQTKYCLTYQDFCNNKWESLDTLYITQRSENKKMWRGGNDYTLSCGYKETDKLLKNEALVVMQGDSLYVNNKNLCYQGLYFGKGYTRAKRIGNRSLLLVNRLLDKESAEGASSVGFMFGAAGGFVAGVNVVKKSMKQQVCYIISKGANVKGKIEIRLIDDDLISQMLKDQGPLLRDYYEEEDHALRILAERVLPILEKSGLMKKGDAPK